MKNKNRIKRGKQNGNPGFRTSSDFKVKMSQGFRGNQKPTFRAKKP